MDNIDLYFCRPKTSAPILILANLQRDRKGIVTNEYLIL